MISKAKGQTYSGKRKGANSAHLSAVLVLLEPVLLRLQVDVLTRIATRLRRHHLLLAVCSLLHGIEVVSWSAIASVGRRAPVVTVVTVTIVTAMVRHDQS
jgi:hypothetical protein